jgi:transcriptional regulator with XRE-family HTH domain
MITTLLLSNLEYIYTAVITLRIKMSMIRLRVREIAEEKKISQSKLGRMADVDVKTIQRIYRNPTTIVTTAVLDRLAVALNVDASLLIESEPPLPKTVNFIA